MRLNDIYRRYQDRVRFVCVYIQEMHPTDGWLTNWNVREAILIAQPTTTAERVEVARLCALKLDLAMPMVIDTMDNTADRLYAALPERLFVIDRAGVVVYASDPGPAGFDVAAWAEAVAVQAAAAP